MEDGKRKKLGDINPHTYQVNSGPLKIKKISKKGVSVRAQGIMLITLCILLLWILLEIWVKSEIWTMMDSHFGDWIQIVVVFVRR